MKKLGASRLGNVARAGALAGTIFGSGAAAAQDNSYDTGGYSDSGQTIQYQELSPQQQATMARMRKFAKMHPKDAKVLANELIKHPFPEAIIPEVTPQVAIEVLNRALDHKASAQGMAQYILGAEKHYGSDPRAAELLLRAYSITKNEFELKHVFEQALSTQRPWVGVLLDQSATVMDRRTFVHVFGEGEMPAIASLSSERRAILLPALERNYQDPSPDELWREWQKIHQDTSFDSSYGPGQTDFVRDVFGNLSTNKQRADFVERLSEMAETAASDDLQIRKVGREILKVNSWWRDDQKSSVALERLVGYFARIGDAYVLYEKDIYPLFQNEPWAARYEQQAIEQNDFNVFNYFEHIRKYPWAEHILVKAASTSPELAVQHFEKYQEAANAFNVVKDAIPRSEGLLVVDKMKKMQSTMPPDRYDELRSLVPKNIPFETAVLATNRKPNYGEFRKDPSLVDMEKINRRLLLPLVSHQADEVLWQRLEEWFKQQSSERVPEKMQLMRELAAQYGDKNPLEMEEAAAYVARNLAEKNIPISDETVHAEVERIQKKRVEVGSINLFAQRVVLVSHEEQLREKQSTQARKTVDLRFGTSTLQERIRERQKQAAPINTPEFTHITPLLKKGEQYESTVQSLTEAKRKALDTIRSAPGPLTVFFDGHGWKDAFYLSDGQVRGVTEQNQNESESAQEIIETDRARKIDVDELAKMLIERFHAQQAQNPAVRESDISLVFSACYMQNFTRLLAKVLNEAKVPAPKIMISASEFGQYSFSDFDNPFGTKFNEMIVTQPTIEGVIDAEHFFQDGNPSIFVPTEPDNAVLMQLSGDYPTQNLSVSVV